MPKKVLVTGAAGFIGSHLSEALCARGDHVVGLDSFDAYYEPARKRENVREVTASCGERFTLVEGDVRDRALAASLFAAERFDAVVHLAALAGVRASIGEAERYFDVNLMGTIALLDACVQHEVPHFVFASTSSVYGNSERLPFVETDCCDRPLAPYPASKRSAELAGHSFHNLHGLSFTALRFFTVYGPRNRPDMMAWLLLDGIAKRTEVPLYAGGELWRDWTYVGDIVQGVVAAVDKPLGFEAINLGRGEPVLLRDFVSTIEGLAGHAVVLRDEPLPPADVRATHANTSKARDLLGYTPHTTVTEGAAHLWNWYRSLRA